VIPIKIREAAKALVRLVVLACVLLIVVGLFCPPPYGKWASMAHAFVSANFPARNLPEQVSIAIDGSTAVFHKGSPDYNWLCAWCQTGRSDDTVLAAAGPMPTSPLHFSPCGSLTIRWLGFPSHYTLYRSTENRNYLWLKLPKLNGTGATLVTIIDDGRLFRLIQDTEKRQQGHDTATNTNRQAK
jgi:hypothetical protein